MDALRNYLAWQSDIGGEEVILTAVPAAPRSAPAPSALSGSLEPARKETPIPHPPSPRPPAGPPESPADGLYEMLARSLQGSESAAREKRAATLGIPPADAAPRKAADAGLPTFASFSAYREHLEKNIRTLLTGEIQGIDWKVVHGEGPEYAPLALVALEARPADTAAGRPFQGEGGQLLGKMMRAIKLDLDQLYRTLVVKVAGPGKVWTRRDMVRLLPLLHAELGLAKAPVVLLLGEACAQTVLKTGRSLEELRGAFHRVESAPGLAFAVTWHPDDLEGKEELKRKAWKDLQWLQTRLQGG